MQSEFSLCTLMVANGFIFLSLDNASDWADIQALRDRSLYTLAVDLIFMLCCDYIKKYSRPIEFLYFLRPINIILSADWSDYIKDITRRLP